MSPPGSLRFVFVFCILSATGTMIYAVANSMSAVGGTGHTAFALALISFVNFVLPLTIACTIVTNHSATRLLVIVYVSVVSLLFLNEWQTLRIVRSLPIEAALLTVAVLCSSYVWLYRSKKMRYYYALIKDQPVPDDLLIYGDSLAGDAWISEKLRRRVTWIIDHMETIVLVGFIIVVIIAFQVIG